LSIITILSEEHSQCDIRGFSPGTPVSSAQGNLPGGLNM
jgi:hypothetical protein